MADIGPFSTNPTGVSEGETEAPRSEPPPSPPDNRRKFLYAGIALTVLLLIFVIWIIATSLGGDEPAPQPVIAESSAPLPAPVPATAQPSQRAVFNFDTCPRVGPSNGVDSVREASRALDILAARGAINQAADDDAVIAQIQAIACQGTAAAAFLAARLPETEVLAPNLRAQARTELQQYAESAG